MRQHDLVQLTRWRMSLSTNRYPLRRDMRYQTELPSGRGCATHFPPSIQRVAVGGRDPYDCAICVGPTGGRRHTLQLNTRTPHMLRGLRTASTGWIGKTIMALVVGVLVIAFAAWGIGDIFRGYSRSYVAIVGSSSITPDQFRQLYQNKLNELSLRLQRPIPPDQARAFGLDRQVLGQWVQDAALDQLARDMRLGIVRRRPQADHHRRPELPRARRPVRSGPFPRDPPAHRPERAGLRRRDAARDVAPADHRHARRRHQGAERRKPRRSTASRTSSATPTTWC